MNKFLFVLLTGVLLCNSSSYAKKIKINNGKVEIIKNPSYNKPKFNQNSDNSLGGIPPDELNGTTSIKGEGIGKGDKPINPERGGMPEFDISGSATCFAVGAKPKIKYYDGENTVDIITTNQKSTSKTKKDESGLGLIAGDADIVFNAKGTLDNEINYGATIDIKAVKDGIGIDKMFISFDHNNFGKINVGNTLGPDATYGCGAQTLIGGTEGIDGQLFAEIDPATGALIPCGPVGFSNKCTKFVYESPKWHGLTFGFGYSPKTSHHGTNERNRTIGDSKNGNNVGIFIKGDDDKESPSGRNHVTFAIKHEYDFGNNFETKIGAFFLAEQGQKIKTTCYKERITEDAKPDTVELQLNGAKAWGLSGTVKYNNFSIALGYFNSGKSRLPQNSEFKENWIFPAFMIDKDGNSGHAFNAGIRYDWNKLAFALVGHRASRHVTKDQKAVTNVLSFTTDYLIRPGLKIFGEIDYINSKSCSYACSLYNLNHKDKDAATEQSGFMFTFGAKVLF